MSTSFVNVGIGFVVYLSPPFFLEIISVQYTLGRFDRNTTCGSLMMIPSIKCEKVDSLETVRGTVRISAPFSTWLDACLWLTWASWSLLHCHITWSIDTRTTVSRNMNRDWNNAAAQFRSKKKKKRKQRSRNNLLCKNPDYRLHTELMSAETWWTSRGKEVKLHLTCPLNWKKPQSNFVTFWLSGQLLLHRCVRFITDRTAGISKTLLHLRIRRGIWTRARPGPLLAFFFLIPAHLYGRQNGLDLDVTYATYENRMPKVHWNW